MREYDSIVIGSGAGGLTAAVCLAKAGHKVLVLEQHYLPGGWCHSFTLDGFQFSPGVHYIGELQEGRRLRKIYEGLGIANDLIFLELNPDGYDHVRIGDVQFDIPKGKQVYLARLQSRFPKEAKGIERYFDYVTRIAAAIDGWSGVRNACTLAFRGLRSIDSLLDHCRIKDPILRTILTIQAGDHGTAPSVVPAAMHIAIVNHYFNGGYYPKGGAKSIPKAYIKALRRHGGKIKVRSEVAQILTEGQGSKRRVSGVQMADGTQIGCRYIVSNADPHITFQHLIGEENLSSKLRRRLQKTSYSVSALSLFLGVDMDIKAAGLDSGNYWYLKSPRGINDFYELANNPDIPMDKEFPGLFLTATTLKDPSKRQDRLHTLESFVFVSYDSFRKWQQSEYQKRPQEYGAFKEHLTDKILQRIDELVPGLSGNIVFKELGTPLTNAHYLAGTKGNLYGTEKISSQVGPFSYPTTTEIEGLHLCGASTLSHGVMGATLTGIAAAKNVLGCRAHELLNSEGQHLRIYPCDDMSSWPQKLQPVAKRLATVTG